MTDICNVTYISSSEKDTEHLGKMLSKITQKGDVFALFGTLGMGKSVLARAFIQNLTDAKEVPSPTFTLIQSYEAANFEIFHFDLYRIKSPEEIFEIGMEDAIYEGVSLIEWPEMMGGYLPKNIFRIDIQPSDNKREIKISTSSPEKQNRLCRLKELLDA